MNERIKEIRTALQLTQEDFGKRIGSARNTIANYETGNRNPSNAVIMAICREFNVNEEWLRTGQGEMFRELDREDEITKWLGSLMRPDNDNEFIKKFIHMLSRLSIEDWKVLEKMVLMMVEERNGYNIEENPSEEELKIINAYENGNEEYQPHITHDELKKQLDI